MLEYLYTQGPLMNCAGRNEPDMLGEVMAIPSSTEHSDLTIRTR